MNLARAVRTLHRQQWVPRLITTASSDEHSIATEVYRYAEALRSGGIDDPTFLSILYAAPEDADSWSEETWRACNPA